MEQARYWMWAKRKHATLTTPPAHNHHQVPDDNSSWEEQAFAEDAAGPLGGCIWPPRSYSCTFCRREFRSAQALGGHMNVHRRDRARLKQSSPNDQNVETALHHHHDRNHHHQDNNISLQINPSISTSTLATFRQHPSHHHHHQVCAAVVYNPSSDPSSSSSPASRVSEAHQLPGRHYHQEQIPIPSSRTSSPPPPSSRSILTANRYYINDNNCVARIKPQGADKISRIVESAAGSTCRANKVATDLSVSLNLVVRCSRPPSAEDDDEATSTCKRRRVATEIKQQSNSKGCSLPFFLKSEGFEELLSSNRPAGSIEELDLELRLGDRPKQVIKVVEK